MEARLTASLHELVFAMDTYSDRILTRDFGIDHNHFVFLSPLEGGPLDVTRLAQRLNLTKAAVSKRVPVLVAEGWLTTTADPGHGRRVLIELSAKGSALVAEAGRLLNDRFAQLLSSVPIDHVELARQLRTLTGAVRELGAGEQ